MEPDEGRQQRDATPARPSGDAHFSIHVSNFKQILSVFGEYAGAVAISEMHRMLAQMLRVWGVAESASRTEAIVRVSALELERASAAIEAAIVSIALTPVAYAGQVFHLALDTSMTRIADSEALGERGEGAQNWSEPRWAESYRDDMAMAAEAISAVAQSRFHLVWQPVKGAGLSHEILYHEGLARFTDGDGGIQTPGAMLRALERAGMMRAFDRHVVSMVLEELETDPDAVLGINISAQSAVSDVWWTSIMLHLKKRPDIAKRFIVEITRPADMPSTAQSFVADMQQLGCRIAFDDFGVGYSATRQLIATVPDIIKIDVLFLQYAEKSAQMAVMFDHLVNIADSMAHLVIVKGIETEAQSVFAAGFQRRFPPSAGSWQQGWLHGRPGFSRTVSHNPDSVWPDLLERTAQKVPDAIVARQFSQ